MDARGRRGRSLALLVSLVPRLARALPLVGVLEHPRPEPVDDDSGSSVLMRACVSAFLVLLGGVFAGLTIGLMGQDSVFLQVTAESGTPQERKHAAKVLKLLNRGKHWVLVTLLLGNVITNETLPIVLDSILGGGWPAIVSSTAAIVVFGEIIPQSVAVRFGLALGAFFAPFVLVLMYIMYPVAVPIAKLLDFCLGEDHGTVYKRAGLKSLVTLHHTMGVERLNADEVTIISAVLDLKEKPVQKIMTPIEKVFVLASDTILDEAMVERILLTGFNRIPIHLPRQPLNFVGMLLVRTLITYDPDDALPISSFALATLPETDPETSCLNILNYFQEGKSHMVVVSTNPGDVHGGIGVVTLEDVIEELIGEEIVDESDVYVDVHKAIRRANPPLFKRRSNQPSAAASSSAIAKLLPSNRASNPNKTLNAKITIKSPQGKPRETSPLLSASAPRSVNGALTPRATSPRDSSSVEVMTSEHAAMQRNLPSEASSSDPSRSPRRPAPRPGANVDDDMHLRIGTFTENVVRVGGVNKVVIAEPSSPSTASSTSSSSG